MPKYLYEFPIGKIWTEEQNGKIISLGCEERQLTEKETKETPLLKETKKQFDEYFAGKRKVFDLPIELRGTEFQKSVWRIMLGIPYGKTMTYGEIGHQLNTKGYQAVGMACRNNHLMIVVPCHRVIGQKGKLTGFYGGLDMKARLLDLENNRDYLKEKR